MRKRRAVKRDVLPDSVYNSKVVTRLVNTIMKDGKKGTAQTIVYDAFDIIKKTTKEEPIEVYNKALENIRPALEVKSRRVGGSNYQVPIEISDDRSQALALRWLVNYAKLRNGKGMAVNLANERVLVEPLRKEKILIRWQRLIKHLLTIDGRHLWQETFH